MFNTKTISNIFYSAFIIYVCINTIVYVYENYLESELKKYDLNENGFFERDEVTKDQQKVMTKVINDTARNIAPITTIPISIILAVILFLILNKRKSMLKN